MRVTSQKRFFLTNQEKLIHLTLQSVTYLELNLLFCEGLCEYYIVDLLSSGSRIPNCFHSSYIQPRGIEVGDQVYLNIRKMMGKCTHL